MDDLYNGLQPILDKSTQHRMEWYAAQEQEEEKDSKLNKINIAVVGVPNAVSICLKYFSTKPKPLPFHYTRGFRHVVLAKQTSTSHMPMPGRAHEILNAYSCRTILKRTVDICRRHLRT